MAEPLPRTSLQGSVERVTFYNPENNFSVLKLRVRGKREPITVVGTLAAAQPGELLDVSGHWHTDARHGAQFQVQSAEIRQPSDLEGIARYLGSGLIRQIGPVLADRIVAVFGMETLAVLDSTPGRVREVPGIGAGRAEAIAAAWIEHRSLRGIVAFLTEHGINTRYAPRLLAAYGPDTAKILSANPYRLVAEVPGLGFSAADCLGSARGVRHTSPVRLQAATLAVLLRANEQGHTRMAYPELLRTAAGAAAVEVTLIEAAIAQQLANGALATVSVPKSVDQVSFGPDTLFTALAPTAPLAVTPIAAGKLRIYEPEAPPAPPRADGPGIGLAGVVAAEEDLARRVLEMARRPGQASDQVQAWLSSNAEAALLSEEQRAAIHTAATHGLFVLTGGPGVGKTTTTRALVQCLRDLGCSVALAAPTGKAAKRLGDVTGAEARTLHRLLGSNPRGFRHGPREPLPFDAVIVDEVSMLDTPLARSLLRAIGPRGTLILVGDADQLPSVGPGQVLRDLLASGKVPSCSLTTVFRQAARSGIVTNAHRIRQGLLPEFADPSALRQGADCIFVPTSADRLAGVGTVWAAHYLPSALGVNPSEVQTLAPLTRVCQALNSSLQERLNPARGSAERPHGALPLRVGDRLIQTRNNYNLGVFNGDTGILAAIEDEALQVDYGDGRVVGYAASDALDLDHAYCLTVHRAQGSEWPGVVVLAHSSHGAMLSRNLLYTAMTRARRAVVIVGDEAGIARAVADMRDTLRVTGLRALLAGTEAPHAAP